VEAQKGWLTLTICSSPLLFAFGHPSGHRLRPHLMPARENNGQQAYAAVILLRLYRAKPDRVTKKGPITNRAFADTQVIHRMSDAVISTAVLYG